MRVSTWARGRFLDCSRLVLETGESGEAGLTVCRARLSFSNGLGDIICKHQLLAKLCCFTGTFKDY